MNDRGRPTGDLRPPAAGKPGNGSRHSTVTPRTVALVHDWLTGMRGGEKVLEAIVELYPSATIHTLLHVKGSVSPTLERLAERRSFVQWLPGAAKHYRQYLPLFPLAIEQFDFDGYDLVISTSHCAAKSVVVPGRARHICYCHSPMRYAWDQFDAYFGEVQVGALRSKLLRPVLAGLARWDRDTAGRVDRYVANSHYVAGRIRRYYNRGSTVVYPPVDTVFYRPKAAGRPVPADSRFLAVSALVPYKRLDLAIRAAAEARMPLSIVGRGPEEARLRQLAASINADVDFKGWLTDEEIRNLYQTCRAAVMPGVEDFGMVPVEAQACGRPVIALAEGGALESIVDSVTGILVGEASVSAFAEAMIETARREFDRDAIRRHAERFGKDRFQEQIRGVIARPADDPAGDAFSECRGARDDARDLDHRREDPNNESNVASERPRRRSPVVREDALSECKGARDDARDIDHSRREDPNNESNVASERPRRRSSAAREDEL